jgi:hypothetical protein
MLKTCCSCKEEKHIDFFYRNGFKKDGTPKYNSWCKKCRLEKIKVTYKEGNQYIESVLVRRTKTERSYLSYLLNKSKQRNKENNLDLDYLYNIYLDQKGLCNLTKVEMTHLCNDLNSISIDRIDSKQGYIKGNIQLVTKTVNIMKWDLDLNTLVDTCKRIIDNVKL